MHFIANGKRRLQAVVLIKLEISILTSQYAEI